MATQQQERQIATVATTITTADHLVDYIKAEQQFLLNRIQQAGYELGLRTASYLAKKDFQHLERVRPLAAAFDEDVLKYLWSYLEMKGCAELVCVHDEDCAELLAVSGQSRVIFCQSWMDGVLHSWDLVKDQIENVA